MHVRSRSANMRPFIASLAISLQLLGVHGAVMAAEASGDRPQHSYAFILEVAPKEGPSQRFSFACAGGKLDVSFVSGQSEVDVTSIPIISSFRAEVEPLQDAKLWLRQLTFTHTVPYVTGFTEYGGNAASVGARVRAIPSRTTRSFEEGATSSEATKPEEPASQPSVPRTTTRSVVQQANVGITTSLVLTVGKAVTLFEDSKGRVRLTVNKVSD